MNDSASNTVYQRRSARAKALKNQQEPTRYNTRVKLLTGASLARCGWPSHWRGALPQCCQDWGRLRRTPGDWRGQLHGWNVRRNKGLSPEVLCHHQLRESRGSGSNPCASTTDPPLPLYEECFHCTSIVQGSVRLSAGRRAGPHARGSTGTSCAAVRLSCASVRPPRVRVAGRRSIVVR